MVTRLSLGAIELDIKNLLVYEFGSKGYPKNIPQEGRFFLNRICTIYTARRNGYTLKQVGDLVGGVNSTILKDFKKAEEALSGKDSPLKTALIICKQRLSC